MNEDMLMNQSYNVYTKEIRKGDFDIDHIQDIEENFHLNYNKKCSV